MQYYSSTGQSLFSEDFYGALILQVAKFGAVAISGTSALYKALLELFKTHPNAWRLC